MYPNPPSRPSIRNYNSCLDNVTLNVYNQADDSFCEDHVLNETPAVFDSVTGENCMPSLGVRNNNCDVSLCNIEDILNCTDISRDQEVTSVKRNTYKKPKQGDTRAPKCEFFCGQN